MSKCAVVAEKKRSVMPERSELADQPLGKILIEFDLHRLIGDSANGRSSCAEAAARLANTVRKVTRVPGAMAR